MQEFKHQHIYDLEYDDFKNVYLSTFPPLGIITPRRDLDDELAVALVGDVGSGSPWTFLQVFHDYLEEKGAVPTWQQLETYLEGPAADRLLNPYKAELWLEFLDLFRTSRESFPNLIGAPTSTLESLFDIGIRWRIGNFYLSALRELDILIRLRREYGLDVNYHLLADAVYKADFWMQDSRGCTRVACLLIESDYYLRKSAASLILPRKTFAIETFKIAKRKVMFDYWPVDDQTVREIAAFFRNPVSER